MTTPARQRILIMMQHITTHGRANGQCLENNHDGGHRGVSSCPGERGAGWLWCFGVVRGAEDRMLDGAARPGPVLYATYVSQLQLDLYTYAFYVFTNADPAVAIPVSQLEIRARRPGLAPAALQILQSICLGKGICISISHASNSLACYNVCCMLLCLYNATDAPLP